MKLNTWLSLLRTQFRVNVDFCWPLWHRAGILSPDGWLLNQETLLLTIVPLLLIALLIALQSHCVWHSILERKWHLSVTVSLRGAFVKFRWRTCVRYQAPCATMINLSLSIRCAPQSPKPLLEKATLTQGFSPTTNLSLIWCLSQSILQKVTASVCTGHNNNKFEVFQSVFWLYQTLLTLYVSVLDWLALTYKASQQIIYCRS